MQARMKHPATSRSRRIADSAEVERDHAKSRRAGYDDLSHPSSREPDQRLRRIAWTCTRASCAKLVRHPNGSPRWPRGATRLGSPTPNAQRSRSPKSRPGSPIARTRCQCRVGRGAKALRRQCALRPCSSTSRSSTSGIDSTFPRASRWEATPKRLSDARTAAYGVGRAEAIAGRTSDAARSHQPVRPMRAPRTSRREAPCRESFRPSSLCTHARTCQGGSCLTCCVCPHSSSATQCCSSS